MAIHHAKLKAAVAKYSEAAAGKADEEIKGLLAADEKGYSEEEISEIVTAITAQDPGQNGGEGEEPKPKKSARRVVAEGKEFRDFNDFNKIYYEGDDVSHFNADQLKRLEELGLI